jgi:tRNA pseudouridine38-40 synthase
VEADCPAACEEGLGRLARSSRALASRSGPPPRNRLVPDASPLRTLRIDLTFDGAQFVGWQRQARGRSVQGELEAALGKVLGAPHTVVGCGRTDAGVHARRFVASTRTAHAMPARRLVKALDGVLPADVGVLAVRDVPAGFHALRSARWKWYRYALLVAATRRPLVEARVWRRPRAPDLAALHRAAEALVGRHDFASFGNAGSPRKGTVRTLTAAAWQRVGARLTFDVVGDGFLYRMVRTLVGTMLRAADTPDPAGDVRAVLAARDRKAAGPAAPARGLTLMDVWYEGEGGPPASITGERTLSAFPPASHRP